MLSLFLAKSKQTLRSLLEKSYRRKSSLSEGFVFHVQTVFSSCGKPTILFCCIFSRKQTFRSQTKDSCCTMTSLSEGFVLLLQTATSSRGKHCFVVVFFFWEQTLQSQPVKFCCRINSFQKALPSVCKLCLPLVVNRLDCFVVFFLGRELFGLKLKIPAAR